MELPLYCAVLTSAAGAVYTRLHRLCLFKIRSNDSPLLYFLKQRRPASILGRRPEHGSFIRASLPVPSQKGWYCFVTNKTIKFFGVKTNLLKHGNGKHLEYSIGSPTFFEEKMRRPSKRCQHSQMSMHFFMEFVNKATGLRL